MAKDVGRDKDSCYPDKEDAMTLPRRRFRLPKVHVCQRGVASDPPHLSAVWAEPSRI